MLCPNMEAQAKSKRQAQQERFRMIFDESLGDQSEPIRHDKAAVLLLSWEKSMDDLNVKPEACWTTRSMFNKR